MEFRLCLPLHLNSYERINSMQQGFRLGEFEIFWLGGGEIELDGGTMFGVVPKVLWEKKFPANADNYVRLVNTAILVKTREGNVLIETGIGNKLTEKQKKIFRVLKEWAIPEALDDLDMTCNDIDHVILTHCDFDHAGGIVSNDGEGRLQLTFPRAVHYIQQLEWEDVLAPNRRSKSAYWPVNLDLLHGCENLKLVDEEFEVVKGIKVMRTGGHTRGHQVVWMVSEGDSAVHMGDLLPSHVYSNPLWITAFDNYPLESIRMKEEIMEKAVKEGMWFIFYHDPFLSACKFDVEGQVIEQREW